MNNKMMNLILKGECPLEKLLEMPIVPRKGNDLFYLGMPLDTLKVIALGFRYRDQYEVGGGFFTSKFIFGHAIQIEIYISPKTSLAAVTRICFFGNYIGCYQSIGIGSSIRELMSVCPNVCFDEEYILVGGEGKIWDLVITIDNDGRMIYDIEDVMDNKIMSIIIEQTN